MSSIESSNFNLFSSFSSEFKDSKDFRNDLGKINLIKSANPEFTQYQKEISRYDRKISLPDGTYNYRGNANYHFEFMGSSNISPEKKQISEKKRKSNIDFNNLSIFKKEIKSNSLYVGFENPIGQNSCYINVVLHFLYYFPCINEFLIKLYLNNKNNINLGNNDITNVNNSELFLFLLGKTLFEYQKVLSNQEKKGITILHTIELRKYLDKISNNEYQLNKVADPVELLQFILNIVNKSNQNEVHKYFFINLIEEFQCERCQNKNSTKYDKDNYIYHIYVEEIMNFIQQNNMTFQNYNHNFFKLSKSITLNDVKNCEKCQNKMKKIIECKGPNYPIFLLINCIYNNPRPPLKDIIKFLYILPLEDCLENLFFCFNNNGKQRIIYNLLGMILYSPTLTHYINVLFNIQKNIFVLYDDDKIKELNSIHEVYKEITFEKMKNNPNAFFYPVLLIYHKEIFYDDYNTFNKNKYTPLKYKYLLDECKRIIKENEIILTNKQKQQNYFELVKAQMKYEQENKNNIDNYFNENDNDKIGCSSLYRVNEEIDDEKDSKSSHSFKMAIDEEANKNEDNIINNNFNNNSKCNNFNNSNNCNYSNINNNNNNYYINNINNMNIESQILNNDNKIKIEKNEFNNNNDNKMNLEDKEFKNNYNLRNNVNNNNNINNNIDNFEYKNFQSGQIILQNNKNNNLFLDFNHDINNIEIERTKRRHKTDSKSRQYHTKKDFFNNIL